MSHIFRRLRPGNAMDLDVIDLDPPGNNVFDRLVSVDEVLDLDAEMVIYVRNVFHNEQWELVVHIGTLIADVMELLYDLEGTPPNRQRLIRYMRQVDRHGTIQSEGIRNRDQLFLVPRILTRA